MPETHQAMEKRLRDRISRLIAMNDKLLKQQALEHTYMRSIARIVYGDKLPINWYPNLALKIKELADGANR